MAGRFVKFEKTLNGTEIQALTEVLAKHLAGMECLDYDNISRLKLNLKYELGQGVIRLKVDYQDTLSTEGGADRRIKWKAVRSFRIMPPSTILK
ncbi:hypothetical protein [Desulfovibrio ferrophilus]|uniref:Uncharacterized protein n=1 Tax=Desulfovibrio ferrophilus TaxID=241368 RepID=A0A2Z6AV18_9BACT|nr:hypothetical protein [Desulfovibrio ferrophilus]BBD07073.1 uncharacterized protein DFE_0347 [Desulfovibrio ferrophilus]